MNRGTRPQLAKTAAIPPGLAAEHCWIAEVCTAPGGLPGSATKHYLKTMGEIDGPLEPES